MNMTTGLLLMYQVFQSLVQANANCDYATVAHRMGTLVRQLMAFDKEILGVTPTPPPVRLLSTGDYTAAATLTSSLKVHKKADSLLWSVGEPVFNKLRDAF